MPASSATAGYGTTLQHNQSGSYATIAEVSRFAGPAPSLQMIDVSNLSSPGDYEEFIAGQIKNGEISGTANFLPDDATQRGMIAAIVNRSKLGFKINWPSGTIWSFSGFVTEYQPTGVVVNNKVEAAFKIKPTGVLTIPT